MSGSLMTYEGGSRVKERKFEKEWRGGEESKVACGQELGYSENLGSSCYLETCVPYSTYCTFR
jgi:hypothetical protein